MKTQNNFFIEQVTNNGVTYFQIVRRRDNAILCSNESLANIAYRLYAGTMCLPTYKDGSIVISDPNSTENALIQIVNQNLLELSEQHDKIQKDIKTKFIYELYIEMISIETEIQLFQQRRDSLISISK